MWDDDNAAQLDSSITTTGPSQNKNLNLYTTIPAKQLSKFPKNAESCSSEDALGDFEAAFEQQIEFLQENNAHLKHAFI